MVHHTGSETSMKTVRRAKQGVAYALPMLLLFATPCFAQGAVDASASQSIFRSVVESLRSTRSHQTLVAIITAANAEINGPLTLFAPTDQAFENMSQERRDTLLLPENIERLRKVLRFHVVRGSFTAAELAEAVRERHGRVSLPTVSGGSLRVTLTGDTLVITDQEGGQARIVEQDIVLPDGTIHDGIIHVIDAVLIPRDSERGFTTYR
jgi:uncharacterized surface protein with fasciclin (FAS1) repeats